MGSGDPRLQPQTPPPPRRGLAHRLSARAIIPSLPTTLKQAPTAFRSRTSLEIYRPNFPIGPRVFVFKPDRLLAAFEEIGVARRSFHHNGTSLYEINIGKEAQYHVVGRDAESVEQLDPESSAELREVIQRIEERLRAHGHSNLAHVVEFFSTAPAHSRMQNPLPVVN